MRSLAAVMACGMPHVLARSMPPNFAELFVRLGWEAIEDHYRTSQRARRQWLREAGKVDLIDRRRDCVGGCTLASDISHCQLPWTLGDRRVSDITATDIAAALEPIWTSKPDNT
jgi:hypothetical protein